ncbi:MAG TPA: efflux RND transporter periplasmic adaptor subunit [Verrucomicrobiae bacterium]|jgi:RND family efflux transporter MFP subunit|nr:efflux RND transporter periplasmic adaptor subunit [Verrucomicrobiae bacterium]
MKGRRFAILAAIVAIAIAVGVVLNRPPNQIVLTGVVTTDSVIVSPQIAGRIEKLYVGQGDTVTNGQLVARIEPELWRADAAFYSSSEQASSYDLAQAQADLENAKLNFERIQGLFSNHVESVQNFDAARTTYDSARAKVDAAKRQSQAAAAQSQKAKVYLDYTRVYAPTNGIVDVRAALEGEVVTAGQAIFTIINPDDLWVSANLEETYIDRIHLGDQLQVRLPSGATRMGTVFFRSVDADYATQRDVSRTKRDIKTFEIRLRCDNSDRALAVGMTAYVTAPLK